jgi:TatA/E family protein of Tat protein translocase
MLDIGIQELLVIMVLALLIFGPDKLPELGRRLGRAMREFRRASDEFRSTVEQNLQLNADLDASPPSTSAPEAVTASADAVTTDAPEYRVGPTDTPADILASGNGATDGLAGDEPLEPYWTSRGGRLLHRRECAWRWPSASPSRPRRMGGTRAFSRARCATPRRPRSRPEPSLFLVDCLNGC